MTLPALRAIREGFPQGVISILAKPWVADLFSSNPLVDQMIVYESPGKHEGIVGKWRLAQELRKERFELAILFQNAFEAALIAYLAGIPRRAGYNTDARGILLTHAVQVNGGVRKGHQVDYYREMVKGLGFQTDSSIPTLSVSAKEKEEASKFLHPLDLGEEEKIVGFGPGATYGPAKQWFPERFAALADRLSKNFGARILIFGSRADSGTASFLIQNTKAQLIDLTGRTTLGQAIGLISCCNLFVTNDSGLMHVAAALGIPVVAIFGSTDPVRTGPLGRNCMIMKGDLSCSPCLKPNCPEKRECMEQISVDQVYAAAEALLNSRDLGHAGCNHDLC
jgi:heptosyltransferase-2